MSVLSVATDRQCDFCDTVEGDGVNVNECDRCGKKCCTVHSDDAPECTVLCDDCRPEEP